MRRLRTRVARAGAIAGCSVGAVLAACTPHVERALRAERKGKASAREGRPPCISIERIERTEVVDNRTIRFHLIDRSVVLSRLPSPCYGLVIQGGFAFATATDQLCSLDLIRVLRPSGGVCALGPFEVEPAAQRPPLAQPRPGVSAANGNRGGCSHLVAR